MNALTGGGATSLHSHSGSSHTIASHSDTTATGPELDTLTAGVDTTLHSHSAVSSHNIASHSDTTATGPELDTLTGGVSTTLHSHNIYEPTFSKNTGFNKNFGTGSTNVAQGNHTHGASSGSMVQVVHAQDGALATGTNIFPYNISIPINTAGNEYMTLAITPTASANKLRIDVTFNLAGSNTDANMVMALFQDTTTNALAVAHCAKDGTANTPAQISLTHYMTAGTTSSTTFKVRAGLPNAGTTTFNGLAGASIFGGVMASSITITEIKA